MTPTLEQNAWLVRTIVKDIASCSLKKLSEHALLHRTWDEPIFSCQTSATTSHALSAFLRDMTCNRPGPKIYCHAKSKFDQCGDGARFRVAQKAERPSTTMFSLMLENIFHREE
jgi:hypothetical protein